MDLAIIVLAWIGLTVATVLFCAAAWVAFRWFVEWVLEHGFSPSGLWEATKISIQLRITKPEKRCAWVAEFVCNRLREAANSNPNFANELQKEIEKLVKSPNPNLQPLDIWTPTRKMLIEIDVPNDFNKRLDNQWVVEREIRADRWNWRWADEN